MSLDAVAVHRAAKFDFLVPQRPRKLIYLLSLFPINPLKWFCCLFALSDKSK